MSYNPYTAAFAALTNQEARRFYTQTAIEHGFLTLAVTGIAAQQTIEAGRSFRQFHDAQLVPFTLLAIATVVEFFVQPSPPVQQPCLSGFTPRALLDAAPDVPQTRVLVTPHVVGDRVLVTPCTGVDLAEDDQACEHEPVLNNAEASTTLQETGQSHPISKGQALLEVSPKQGDRHELVQNTAFVLILPNPMNVAPSWKELTVSQLRKLASKQGIKNVSKKSKTELIALLSV